MTTMCLVFAMVAFLSVVTALNNGLARLPPMGFQSWSRFQCNTDCEKNPNFCIREQLFKEMAKVMVREGYRDAGYNLIIIGDCWMAPNRLANGTLTADPKRFPNGIKALADYMHNKGLKLGIFQSLGEQTCNGYPGLSSFLADDAKTFAEWGIDHVEIDACNETDVDDIAKGYTDFGMLLNNSGRRMTYSCNWPLNLVNNGVTPDYAAIAKVCTMWRFYQDIQDSFNSVESITDAFGQNLDALTSVGGPGQWNYPGSLILGNFGLSYEQARTQIAIWAVLAAPLIISADLRCMEKEFRDLYLNKFLIDIDQDRYGLMPSRVSKANDLEIWWVPVSPCVKKYYSYSIAFVNRRTNFVPSIMTAQLQTLGLNYTGYYQLTNVFTYEDLGDYKASDSITVLVNPTGTVLLHARALKTNQPRGWYDPRTGNYTYRHSKFSPKKMNPNYCKLYH